jgi:hypothetical protein
MQSLWQKPKKTVLWFSVFILLVSLLAACAGSSTSTPSSAISSAPNISNQSKSLHVFAASNAANTTTGSSSTQQTSASDIGPQYLIKTLTVDMQVKDTRNVADTIQSWITTTDLHATSSGTNYQQIGDNLYNVSLTFSVQATLYPQIYQYLRDYTAKNGGHLVKFNEAVQDITDTYVDTQSRIQNLRVEQGRLQDLLSHAQSLSDILTIEQKLSDVEGQIESDEAQFNTLTSQITFYTVSISLEPIVVASPPPSQPENSWSIGQIFHDAFAASLALGEGIIAFIVWILAFSLYIIPIAIIAWFARRWYKRSTQTARPKVAVPLEE